jgi:hypothetical protein
MYCDNSCVGYAFIHGWNTETAAQVKKFKSVCVCTFCWEKGCRPKGFEGRQKLNAEGSEKDVQDGDQLKDQDVMMKYLGDVVAAKKRRKGGAGQSAKVLDDEEDIREKKNLQPVVTRIYLDPLNIASLNGLPMVCTLCKQLKANGFFEAYEGDGWEHVEQDQKDPEPKETPERLPPIFKDAWGSKWDSIKVEWLCGDCHDKYSK